MSGVDARFAWLLAALPCLAQAAADIPAPPFTALAHSALLRLEGGTTPTGIVLRVRHAADQTPLAVTELSVRVDGRGQPALRRADDTWFVALPPGERRADAALEVTVAHDGLRELLEGRIARPDPAAPADGARGGLLHDHKQMAWWILNIGIVLIAAIAISRRMS